MNGVAFHPTKNILASCSHDRTIKLWNTDTGAELSTLRCDSCVNSVSWSPDGAKIAAGSDDKKVRIFDVASGALVGSPLTGHRYVLFPIFFRFLDLFDFFTGVKFKFGCFWVYIPGASGDFTGLVKPGF